MGYPTDTRYSGHCQNRSVRRYRSSAAALVLELCGRSWWDWGYVEVTVGEVGQFLTGIAAIFSAVSAVVGLRNGRKIDAVHTATNGKMEELLNLTKTASFAAGQKDQKDTEQAKVP